MNKNFEINGVEYVGTREVARAYGYCRSKVWNVLNTSGIQPVKITNAFWYPMAEVAAFIAEYDKK